jgi:hypothetical protein
VKLGANEVERIELYLGDDLKEIAWNFAKKHSLSEVKRLQMQQMLTAKLVEYSNIII